MLTPTRIPTPARWPGVLALGLVLTACRAPGGQDLDVRLVTAPDPPRVGATRLDLTLPSGLEGATLSVEGNMTHAGMAPVSAPAPPVGAGRYVVEAFDFTMAGDWVLTVTARTGDGRTLTRDLPLEVRAP